jgi:hypothetical protein
LEYLFGILSYFRFIIFQSFHIFIAFFFHILDSLLNFIHLYFFSSFNCLFTFSLRLNTNFCVSSLRLLIIFTMYFGIHYLIAFPVRRCLDSYWWNWLLMESGCLAVSFCFEIYASVSCFWL